MLEEIRAKWFSAQLYFKKQTRKNFEYAKFQMLLPRAFPQDSIRDDFHPMIQLKK